MHIDVCIDMCIDMYIDMCIDMCVDMCIDTFAARAKDMYMCIDTFAARAKDMYMWHRRAVSISHPPSATSIHMAPVVCPRHVDKHVNRRVHRHASDISIDMYT